MRRFGRRRRAPVVWLPVLGTSSTELLDAAGSATVGRTTVLTTPADGTIAWDAQPVTFDTGVGAESEQFILGQRDTLRDMVEGQEYRLKRLVGKCFAATQGVSVGTANPVQFAAGFMVVKTTDDGEPTCDFNDVNPLAQNGAEDPWIWRRTWVLSPFINPAEAWVSQYHFEAAWPQSTADYGSVQDGPHIDAKTARRIHRQERLFFIVASRSFNMPDVSYISTGTPQAVNVKVLLDLRILGQLVASSRGNRGNASR